MSTNYTANYRLCQWEPSDQVLRTDFNADNAKIDAALKAHDTAIRQVKAVADTAYTLSNLPIVAGAYTGDGAASQKIALGFQPRAVLVFCLSGDVSYLSNGARIVNNGFAMPGKKGGDGQCGSVSVLSDGFQVSNLESGRYSYGLNAVNREFIYFAVR